MEYKWWKGIIHYGCGCNFTRESFQVIIRAPNAHNFANVTYRKPPTISPGLIFFRKRFLMGLYRGGGLIYGRAYTWTIFCVSVIVINKYSNSDKQVLSIVIIVINSNNSD
jgi:hypothetical protein